jgi:hypothetical protein
MPKIVQSICHSVAMICAFASLLPETALAQQGNTVTVVNPATRPVPTTVLNPSTAPVPTTVLNPSTAPVPTTVLNPASQPALTRSVDDPGRIAYQETGMTTCFNQGCDTVFSTVPAGRRLVVQHFSIVIGAIQGSVSFANGAVYATNSSAKTFFLAPGVGSNQIFFNQPILAYADGGQNVHVGADVNAGAPNPDSFSSFATITGYLLDCSATPCNPIAP